MPGRSVVDLLDVQSFSSGASASHYCVTLPDQSHACWGRFESGQLGDGTADYGALDAGKAVPSRVLGDPGFSELALGALNSCGISNGALYCWGDGSYGQLTEAAPVFTSSPFQTSIVSDAKRVAVGAGVICAIVGDHVLCWGTNDGGILGRDLRCGIDPNPDACISSTPRVVRGL